MPNQIVLYVLALLCLLPACQSTQTLTVSYKAIDVPAAPRPIADIPESLKQEPALPKLNKVRTYGDADLQAQKLGLYVVALQKWGRGLIAAIEKRERAERDIAKRQAQERAAALARIAGLNAKNIQEGQ